MVEGLPLRGETADSNRRFGPLEAATGRTIETTSNAAPAKGMAHDHAFDFPGRVLMASTRQRLLARDRCPVQAENGRRTGAQQWYGGPGPAGRRVDGCPMRDRWCVLSP